MPYYLKTVLVFAGSLMAFRLLGKRAVAEMSNYDLAVVMLLTTVLAEPLVTKDLWVALYGGLLLAALYLAVAFLVLKSRFAQKLVLAKPITLIARGKVDYHALFTAKLTLEEFLALAREAGYTGPTEIEWAMMEPTGKVSFLPKASARPVQPPDLKLAPSSPAIPLQLALDGKAHQTLLRRIGKDEAWLRHQVASQNANFESVVMALLDETGQLWLFLQQPMRLVCIPDACKVQASVFDTPFPAS